MKIRSLRAQNVKPTHLVEIADLSDVVVLAGPNGVGKTRLISALTTHVQNQSANPQFSICLEATCDAERTEWGKSSLDTKDQPDLTTLRSGLQRNRRRNNFKSTFLQFESNRSIQQLNPYAYSWDYRDPFEEEVIWNMGFSNMTNRFQDLLHSIFRKVRSRREAIALRAEELMEAHKHAVAQGATDGNSAYPQDAGTIKLQISEFPDALAPFKSAFRQLLAPKELLDAEVQKQQLFYQYDGAKFPITDLSSGEREVVNIVFDFLLRGPTDSIILFDEPELHLHPELSYRLLQTLRNAGVRNQFIFCTHSAEIITASLENTVVFIAPPTASVANQAIIVKENDETNEALKLLGQSIGIISLGKKIVLIESVTGSLDKQTYGSILKNRFPELVLVPSGGKDLIRGFANLNERVLGKTIWGVEFFMLCDRDAFPLRDVTQAEAASKGRLKVLTRYHLENYFLDEKVIAKLFETQVPASSWLRSTVSIRDRLREIAQQHVSYAAALSTATYFRDRVGNINILPKGCNGMSTDELVAAFVAEVTKEKLRVEDNIKNETVGQYVRAVMREIEDSLSNDSDIWRERIPGRVILKQFCSSAHANIEYDRFKLGYISAAEANNLIPFSEITSIFEHFNAQRHGSTENVGPQCAAAAT